MKDYYDYAPQLHLTAPTVISGYLTDFTRSVTYRAASLLGLPYHDVDRLVEHEAGMHIARLILEEGPAAYRDLESQILERVLHQRPVALVALGDGGFLRPGNLIMVREVGRPILLDFALAGLYWRLQQLSRRGELADWQSIYGKVPATLDEMRPYFQERRPAFSQIDLRIEADNLSRSQACQALVDCLARESA